MNRLLCVLLALPLTACSGGESTGSTPAPAADAADAATPEVATEPTPEPTPAPAGSEGLADGPSVQVDDATGFNINSSSIPTAEGTVLGGINAFCEPADEDHVRWGGNLSPQLRWENAPAGTKSFALLMFDPDVPTTPERVNKEGITIPEDAPRTRFYHWVLVDIPAARTEIPAEVEAKGVTEKGKPLETNQYGKRGANDFTGWFADDEAMKGTYAGYDGPCPPWNDLRIHRYVFQITALDVETLGLVGAFTGADVTAAMEGHALATASFTTVYWVNPAIVAPPAK